LIASKTEKMRNKRLKDVINHGRTVVVPKLN